jgi:hypothetical protein
VATLLLLPGLRTAHAQATSSIAERIAKTRGKLAVALVPVAGQEVQWTKQIMVASFEDALLGAGRFKVLSRTELESVQQEQQFAASGAVDPTSAVKLGKALSANYVLIVRQLSIDQSSGTSTMTALTGFGKKKTKYTINIQAQVLDAESGELVQSESFQKPFETAETIIGDTVTATDSDVAAPYRKIVDELAKGFTLKLAAAVPLEGLVVMARDAKNIYLDIPQDAGVRPGTVFELTEEGEPITGPSGEVLGYDSTLVGAVRVTSVQPKLLVTELVRTYGADQQEETSADFTKIKQYLVGKMVPASR